MSWNGSGTFNRDYNWQADRDASIKILAVRMDGEFDNYKGGLQNCITRDGQTPPTADISWGGRKITNLATGTVATDACTVGQANNLSTVFIARDGSGPPTADIPWGSRKITALAAGTVATDAVNYGQIQALLSSSGGWSPVTGTFSHAGGGNSISIAGVNLVSTFPIGSRAAIVHTGGAVTSYATVIAATFSTNTTVTFSMDSPGPPNNITNPVTAVSVSILPSNAAPRMGRGWAQASSIAMTSGGGNVTVNNWSGNKVDVLNELDSTTGLYTVKVAGTYLIRVTGSVRWATAPTFSTAPTIGATHNGGSITGSTGTNGTVPTSGISGGHGAGYAAGFRAAVPGDTFSFYFSPGVFTGGSSVTFWGDWDVQRIL